VVTGVTADEVALRLAVPSDYSGLTEVERASDTVFEAIGIWPLPQPAPPEDFASADAVLVAGDPPVGFARIDVTDDVAHLEQLAVHPDATRRGVGARLLEAVVDWARDNRCTAVTLATFRDVLWNGPFYARHGFVETAANTPALQRVAEHERALGLDRFGARVLMYRSTGGA
jgi:GNAT superfamily N-acetyltransferase